MLELSNKFLTKYIVYSHLYKRWGALKMFTNFLCVTVSPKTHERLFGRSNILYLGAGENIEVSIHMLTYMWLPGSYT